MLNAREHNALLHAHYDRISAKNFKEGIQALEEGIKAGTTFPVDGYPSNVYLAEWRWGSVTAVMSALVVKTVTGEYGRYMPDAEDESDEETEESEEYNVNDDEKVPFSNAWLDKCDHDYENANDL